MKKCLLLLLICICLGCLSEQTEKESQIQPKQISQQMEFWQTQRKGANGNLTNAKPELFSAADSAGIQFIRFQADRLEAEDKDFLIGDADNFTNINQTDLTLLVEVLDDAYANNQRIILAMFELPGCRSGNESGEKDYRLWHEESFQLQSFEFWRQLSAAVKDHPAIVAYNILNEPHPELEYGHEEPNDDFINWLDEIKGTPADLNSFNRKMVEAIREVDPDMPIMIEGYFYSDPIGMPFMEVIDDANILYSFHNPAPWQFTSYRANKKRYSYPDSIPEYWNVPGAKWTIDNLREKLEPVHQFIKKNNIPVYKIVASEFWCDRRVGGCAEYFSDLISLYNEQNWHWAFYAFREDMDWTGLDYEMGDKELGAAYWDALENGSDKNSVKDNLRQNNPIWEVLQNGLLGN